MVSRFTLPETEEVDTNTVILERGKHQYRFIYMDERYSEMLILLVKCANDSRLNFTPKDAYNCCTLMKQLKEQNQ